MTKVVFLVSIMFFIAETLSSYGKPLDIHAAELLKNYNQAFNRAGATANRQQELYIQAISWISKKSLDAKIASAIILRESTLDETNAILERIESNSENKLLTGVVRSSQIIRKIKSGKGLEKIDFKAAISKENNLYTRLFLVNYFGQVDGGQLVPEFVELLENEKENLVQAELLYFILKNKDNIVNENIKSLSMKHTMPPPENLATILALITPGRSVNSIETLPATLIQKFPPQNK